MDVLNLDLDTQFQAASSKNETRKSVSFNEVVIQVKHKPVSVQRKRPTSGWDSSFTKPKLFDPSIDPKLLRIQQKALETTKIPKLTKTVTQSQKIIDSLEQQLLKEQSDHQFLEQKYHTQMVELQKE